MSDERTPALVVAGSFRLAEDDIEPFLRAVEPMREATLREPGCISYAFYADVTDRTRFHVFEEWESDEALAAHFQTPHMATFQKTLAERKPVSIDIRRYRVSAVEPLG